MVTVNEHKYSNIYSSLYWVHLMHVSTYFLKGKNKSSPTTSHAVSHSADEPPEIKTHKTAFANFQSLPLLLCVDKKENAVGKI